MTKEKEEAASAYLQKVFEQEEAVEDSLLRPVEEAIVRTMKESLLTYRKYVKDTFDTLRQNEERKAQ